MTHSPIAPGATHPSEPPAGGAPAQPGARAAAAAPAAKAWLGVEAGGLGFLVPLPQAGEIFPWTDVLPVAHTKPWFLGVANLRGGLHGVVDLAAFLGLPSATASEGPRGRMAGRLLALNPELRGLCALRVDHLCGLRRRDEGMQALPVAGACPSFAVGVWRDAQGRLWQELDLERLVASEAFLAIGVVAGGPAPDMGGGGAPWA